MPYNQDTAAPSKIRVLKTAYYLFAQIRIKSDHITSIKGKL